MSEPIAKTATGNAPNATAAACNSFGLDLYQRLRVGEGNVFISPYSILAALSMAAEGAQNATAEEMHRVLHFPARAAAMREGVAALDRRLQSHGDTPEMRHKQVEIEKLQAEHKAIQQRTVTARDVATLDKLADEDTAIVDRLNALLATYDPTQLSVANALWGEKTYPFKKSYLDSVAGFYGTGSLQQADFRTRADAERGRINSWCDEKTHGRIQNLLPPGSVDALTRLVLTNAIYFKGEWKEPFEAQETQQEDFTLATGDKVKVPLMKQRYMLVRYGAFESGGAFFETPVELARGDEKTPRYPGPEGFALVELPYRGDRLSMVILAPNRASGLAALEASLDAKKLTTWIGELRRRAVHVHVPRFKMETEYTLNETLTGMGMKSAFKNPAEPGGADFGGMSDSKQADERLFISLVRHKAFVEVNEKGTEAAAATALIMPTASAVIAPTTVPFTPVFRADRPCIYLIRDVESGCILFLGRMTRPS